MKNDVNFRLSAAICMVMDVTLFSSVLWNIYILAYSYTDETQLYSISYVRILQ